jgi:hypothetical protein
MSARSTTCKGIRDDGGNHQHPSEENNGEPVLNHDVLLSADYFYFEPMPAKCNTVASLSAGLVEAGPEAWAGRQGGSGEDHPTAEPALWGGSRPWDGPGSRQGYGHLQPEGGQALDYRHSNNMTRHLLRTFGP